MEEGIAMEFLSLALAPTAEVFATREGKLQRLCDMRVGEDRAVPDNITSEPLPELEPEEMEDFVTLVLQDGEEQ
jgi:hypothetical protein